MRRGGAKKGRFDPYEVLGVSPDASFEEIRRRYRELVRTHHPDVRPDKERAHEEFLRIQEAYRLLSDPKLRERYDRLRRRSEEAARRMVEEARRRIEEVEGLLLSAEVDLVRGDLPSAARKCQEVLRRQPGSAPAYALLAEVFLRAGREKEAVAALSMAIQHDPDNPVYHRRLNEIVARRQREEEMRAKGPPIERGAGWMRWAALSLALLWCGALIWLVRLYPGEPLLLGIPSNVLVGAAAMGLVEGAALSAARVLRRFEDEALLMGSSDREVVSPIGVFVLVFGLFSFWLALAMYLAAALAEEYVSPSVLLAFFCAILTVGLLSLAHPAAWKAILGLAGNFAFPAFLVGWMVGGAARPEFA